MADRAPHRNDAARRPRVGRRTRLFAGCFALALLFALPAWSGNLVQVRVGNHPTYTRVVFEFDAPSGYRIERQAPGEADNAIVVTLDAASRARNVVSKSKGVESVSVDAGTGRAVARILTREAGLPIREMILADPPRVVLDLLIPGAEPAPRAEVAATQPSTAEPEAQPEPIAEQPAEITAVEPEPEIAEAPPEREIAPARPEEIVAAEAEATAVVEAAAADAADAGEQLVAAPEAASEDLEEPAAETGAEVAEAADEADAPLAVIDIADLTGEAEAVEPATAPETPEAPAARESQNPFSKLRARTGDADAPFDLKLAGMIGVAVLTLFVLVVLVVRSRAPKPDEMDVTALAGDADDADEASHEGRIPEGGFAMDADLHEDSHPAEDFEFGGVEADDDENKPIESTEVAPGATPGLFDESPQEEVAMSMDNQDLPTTHMDSEAPTQLGIGAAAVGAGMDSNVANLIQELERRMAHMEARLDESNEARERLERQVEAQAEELRVQRAAIARTQRALRSLNRSEEDQATEPALRDPSTPAG